MKVQETCSKERDKLTFGSIEAGECFSYLGNIYIKVKVYDANVRPIALNAIRVKTGGLVIFSLDCLIEEVHKDAVLMTKGC